MSRIGIGTGIGTRQSHIGGSGSGGEQLVVNGTFDTDLTGWTIDFGSPTVVAGELSVTSDHIRIRQDISVTPSTDLEVSVGKLPTGCTFYIYDGAGFSPTLDTIDAPGGTVTVTPTQSTVRLRFFTGTPITGTADNVSAMHV